MPPKRPQTLVESRDQSILLWSVRTAVTVLVISLCLAIICAFCGSCILDLEIQRCFSNRPEMLLFSYTHHQWPVTGRPALNFNFERGLWVGSERFWLLFGDSWLTTSDAKGEPRDRRVTSKSRRDCSRVLSVCIEATSLKVTQGLL
jgi:hypothetical protein